MHFLTITPSKSEFEVSSYVNKGIVYIGNKLYKSTNGLN